ncbi:hypothetical protein J132_00466 [Termitomyces sp. J132]|nr:hypothetical protein J132_00466 [Termitomyces sp. J132]
MNILNPKQPWIREGRYAVPTSLLEEEELIDAIEEMGMRHMWTMESLHGRRMGAENLQTTLKFFKDEIIMRVREYSKIKTPRIKKELQALLADRERVHNNSEMDKDEKSLEVAFLDNKIQYLEN